MKTEQQETRESQLLNLLNQMHYQLPRAGFQTTYGLCCNCGGESRGSRSCLGCLEQELARFLGGAEGRSYAFSYLSALEKASLLERRMLAYPGPLAADDRPPVGEHDSVLEGQPKPTAQQLLWVFCYLADLCNSNGQSYGYLMRRMYGDSLREKAITQGTGMLVTNLLNCALGNEDVKREWEGCYW